jgi:adenylyltransferase/sulfurtransferase
MKDGIKLSSRFNRQMMLAEIGEAGQQRLERGKVLLVGAGGLGSSVAYYLAAAGVGTIGIADHDVVDITNLNRQILHTLDMVGHSKVASAEQAIQRLDPTIRVIPYLEKLITVERLTRIVAEFDILVDCTDNFATRYCINEACVLTGKPMVYGAVSGFEGQAMTIVPGKGPCYRCLYPSAGDDAAVTGILGVTPGLVGIIQAAETIKFLIDKGSLLLGRLIFVDLWDMTFSEFKVNRNPDCATCGTWNR